MLSRPQYQGYNGLQEVCFMADDKLFVERRPEGDYAVRRPGSERASAVEPTQAEAIERAKQINNGGAVLVERVRNTDVGGRDKWRKP
jgi:hypothetical protein